MRNRIVERITQETVDYETCLWLYANGFFGNDDVDIFKTCDEYVIVSKQRDAIYEVPRWFDVLVWLNNEKSVYSILVITEKMVVGGLVIFIISLIYSV